MRFILFDKMHKGEITSLDSPRKCWRDFATSVSTRSRNSKIVFFTFSVKETSFSELRHFVLLASLSYSLSWMDHEPSFAKRLLEKRM